MSTTIWRISKRKHAATAYSGEGARRCGGRWNSSGMKMVYASATQSLSALEILVHMDYIQTQSLNFVAINAKIPDDLTIKNLQVCQLPVDWQNYPAPKALATIGDRWLAKMDSAVLAVPSVIIPKEQNYLLNPNHPDFHRIQIGSSEPFFLDSRLLE